MIVDSVSWQIQYLVVDTTNWLPWSKKVIVSVNQIEKINYANREAEKHTTEKIRNAPEYNSSGPPDENYERTFYDYY